MAHVQGHLAAQDVLLSNIAAKIGLDPVPLIDTPSDENLSDDENPAGDETSQDPQV